MVPTGAVEPVPVPILSVRHRTTYRYRQPVAFGEHRIMFRPRDSYDQRLISATLDITPTPFSLRWLHDVFGNCVAVATFQGRASALTFDCAITLDHTPELAPLFPIAPHAAHYPFGYGADDMPDLSRSIERQHSDPKNEVDAWARSFVPAAGRIGTQDLLAEMTRHVRANFAYLARSEKGVQDPITTLRLKRGSCRDFAVLMIEAVRALGMAARYATHLVAMRDGAIVAQGTPAEVLTAERVEAVFGLPCVVVPDPETGTPLIVPRRRAA